MKNKQYLNMYNLYKEGYSLEQVGNVYGMTRQSVYSGFKIRGYVLRKKRLLPFQIYKGIKFSLRNHGYYSRTDGNRELMHRFVWEDNYGKISAGHDIHHKDQNKSNNKIENLELYTKSEHARKFTTGNNQFTKKEI